MAPRDENLMSITKAEHISPTETGDNIPAKRVAVYVWNGSTWERMSQPGGSGGAVDQGEAGEEAWLFADINKQDALPYAEVLTGSATITPTSGKRIKIVKSQILQNPGNETFNLVTLNFTSTGDFFTCWAGSDSNEWIGDVDEDLNITLANSQPVSVNIRYKEI